MPRGVPLDERQLAEIKASLVLGKSQSAIARNLGITQQAVSSVGIRCRGDIAELKAHKNPKLARRYEQKLKEMLEAITPEKIRDAPLRDIAMTASILLDRWRLLSGEPTAIQEGH